MKKPQNNRKTVAAKRVKRTARVEFANGAKFYATANDFWGWVKRGFVRRTSDKLFVGEVLI